MKQRTHGLLLLFALLGAGFCILSSSSGGVFGKSTSGCGGNGCHQNAPTTTMNVTGIPASGYVNGQSYTMTLTVTNAAKAKAGFNLTVNEGSLTAGAGMSLNGTQELKHDAPLIMSSGTSTWTFTWTAPATGVNPVIFFMAGNAVDGNNQSSNDEFDTNQFQFSCATASALPTISNVSAAGTSSTSGTVNASVNANGDPASVNIEYGPTASYGNSIVANPAVVTGSTPVPVSGLITGLSPATLYHYRVVAINTNGTVYSNDATFTTQSASSVEDLDDAGVQVFPNPATTVLEYHDVHDARPVRLHLHNLLGMPLPAEVIALGPGHYRIHMDHFPAGIYFLLAEREGLVRVKRVIRE